MSKYDYLPVLKELADQPKQTNIYLCEGLFVKHMIFDEGTYIPQHSHETDHLSVIATGAVRAWREGTLLGDFQAPAAVLIKARTKHTFMALQPHTTVLCVHRVDDGDDPMIHEEHHFEGVSR